MPLLDELAARIVEQGAGVLNQDLFLSSKATIPTGDGPYTSLVETGGMRTRRSMNRPGLQRPAVHVVVRSKNYQDARARAVAVYKALGGDAGLYNTTLSGVPYLSVTPAQQLLDMGLDDRQRARVSFNVDIEKAIS